MMRFFKAARRIFPKMKINKTYRVTIRMTDDELHWLKTQVASQFTTLSQLVRDLINAHQRAKEALS